MGRVAATGSERISFAAGRENALIQGEIAGYRLSSWASFWLSQGLLRQLGGCVRLGGVWFGDFCFRHGRLQAVAVECQRLCLTEVALCGQFLAVEFKIERAHVAGTDDDFILRADGLLRRSSQEGTGDDFAIDGNGHPGILSRPDHKLKGRVCRGRGRQLRRGRVGSSYTGG